MMMKAWVLHGIGDLRYENVPIPEPSQDEALIRLHACGVCGSDIPRIFESGTYHFPTIPGHEMAGEVASAPDGSGFQAGDRVAIYPLIPCQECFYCQIGEYPLCQGYDFLGSRCDGGFAEFVTAPVANLVQLPDGVSYVAGAMTEPLAVALHAVRAAALTPVDSVAVLGCGPIGMMVAWWARLSGARRVFVTDVDPLKLAAARAVGFNDALHASEQDIVSRVLAETDNIGVDATFEAAGVPVTLRQALQITRAKGRVIVIGNPADDVRLPRSLVSQMLRKELLVRGSWSSSYVAGLGDEWAAALQAAAQGTIPVEDFVSHRVRLPDAMEILTQMHERQISSSRVVLTM